MTEFQWKVIIALCRVVRLLALGSGFYTDIRLEQEFKTLEEAIRREND